jgi:hypothetical protein
LYEENKTNFIDDRGGSLAGGMSAADGSAAADATAGQSASSKPCVVKTAIPTLAFCAGKPLLILND